MSDISRTPVAIRVHDSRFLVLLSPQKFVCLPTLWLLVVENESTWQSSSFVFCHNINVATGLKHRRGRRGVWLPSVDDIVGCSCSAQPYRCDMTATSGSIKHSTRLRRSRRATGTVESRTWWWNCTPLVQRDCTAVALLGVVRMLCWPVECAVRETPGRINRCH
jgi:hypothetical protein